MFDDLYYRHSGRFSVLGVLAGLAAGTVAAMVLSFAYAYALLYIPIVYASFFVCAAYGAAIGFASVACMVRFKMRNSAVMAGVTLLVTLVGFYFSWVVWLYGLLRRDGDNPDLAFMLIQPTAIWELVLDVNAVGAWTMGRNGQAVTGIMLWVVWAAEAFFIFAVPVAIVLKAVAKPFCEECETWCKEETGIAVLSLDETDSLREHMEAKDFAHLERIGPAPVGASHWLQLDLYVCPNCGKTTTLSASEVKETVNRKGEKSTTTKTLVNRLLLDPAQRETLRQMCSRVEAARLAAIDPASPPSEPTTT